MVDMLFSHDKPRQYQDQFVKDVWRAVNKGRHLLAHAPTGIGKTAASLGPALTWALENDGTVFFLTPKISQHKIAVDELLRIHKKSERKFRAVDIIGRRYTCVDHALDALESDEFYEVCTRRRKAEACPFFANARGFSPGQRKQAKLHMDKFMEKYGIVMPSYELVQKCRSFVYGGERKPLCAYEIMTQIAQNSDVIIADYFHLLAPSIREGFLIKTKKDLSNSVIIIDEAHNVPDRVRSQLSVSVTHLLVKKAEKEMRLLHARDLFPIIRRFEKDLTEILSKKLVSEAEIVIDKSDVSVPTDDDIEQIHDVGVSYLETTNRNKSASIRLAKFLDLWKEDISSYIRIAKRWRNGGITVSYKNLDPGMATKDLVDTAHSVIMMSGTLVPMEMYRDLLGFDKSRTDMNVYKSPFPKHNKENIVYTGVTTRYSKRGDDEFRRIGTVISKVLLEIPGNVAVFFPSYGVLEGVRHHIKTDRHTLVQSHGSGPSETGNLVQRFREMSDKGGLLLAVSGGSLSEGIDYPGRDLMGVIIVGVPLSEYNVETKALIDYYEYKFGAGMTYGYIFPAMTKAVQAAGRLIRNEDDKGVVVFLDERYAWANYKRCFLPDVDLIYSTEPWKDVKRFFSSITY